MLSYWQFLRAQVGNGRSLGYALQWPGSGVFVIGVWFWLARDAVRAAAPGRPAARPSAAGRVRVEHRPGRVPDDVVLPAAPSTAGAAAAGPDVTRARSRRGTMSSRPSTGCSPDSTKGTTT